MHVLLELQRLAGVMDLLATALIAKQPKARSLAPLKPPSGKMEKLFRPAADWQSPGC